MTFAKTYLRDPNLKAEITKFRPWGASEVSVDFAGGGYRFRGLNAEQERCIRHSFKGFCPPPSEQPSTAVDCRVLRCDDSMFRFSPPKGWEYRFDRSYSDDAILLAGHRFFGEVRWRPEVAGTICTGVADHAAFALVFENFFRVLAAYRLLKLDGMILHSACIAREGRAYLFLGHSGAGKTTLSTMAQGEGWEVLSDDLNATRQENGRWYVERLPFAGDLGRTPCRGTTYPLAGIFGLHQSRRNRVTELPKAQAVAKALACSPVVNDDGPRADDLFTVLASLVETVPTMALEFTKDGGALSLIGKITDQR